MLKFFRSIRKNLLAQGNTGKYFKYAIGEIILVVIGILIALSINNWNESKKEHKKLTNALTEIKKDLVIESNIFLREIKIKNGYTNAQMHVIQVLEKKEPIYPEFTNDLGKVFLGRKIRFTRGGYELLNELGLSNIPNDLRNTLIRYYDIQIPAILSDINDDRVEFENVWLPYLRNHFYNFKFGEETVPRDINQFLNDPYILSAMKMNLGNAESTINALKKGEEISQSLIDLISKELEQ